MPHGSVSRQPRWPIQNCGRVAARQPRPGGMDAGANPRSCGVDSGGVDSRRRRASGAPAADPGLSGRRIRGRSFRPAMGAIATIDQHHRRARPDLHAVHDRAGDRPEKNQAGRQRHPGHLGGADLRLLRARACAVHADRHSARRPPLRRALPGRRRLAEQHRHHRQGAVRQVRARHAAGPHHARRAGGAGPHRDPVPRHPAEPQRSAGRCCAALGGAGRGAACGGAADQPLHAAASVPADRAPARAGAGRRAGVVLRDGRVRRIPRPVPGDGGADRGRLAVDLPLRARRHRQGHVAPRFLHHVVLRGARHEHPACRHGPC